MKFLGSQVVTEKCVFMEDLVRDFPGLQEGSWCWSWNGFELWELAGLYYSGLAVVLIGLHLRGDSSSD